MQQLFRSCDDSHGNEKMRGSGGEGAAFIKALIGSFFSQFLFRVPQSIERR
jgi:hypothetical protein